MKDLPNSAWAAVFIFMACLLSGLALFSHNPNATAVITMGSSIITGAFGYIQGYSAGKNQLQVPMDQPGGPQVNITPQPQPPAPPVP